MLDSSKQDQMDPVEFVEHAVASQNLAEDMEDQELASIANDVLEEYRLDKESMSEWLDMMERGIDLAKLVKTEKSYPFKGAANIKYPLITSAALQFNARAYPAICAPAEIVKVKTHGADPTGAKASRAERVSMHMSWQLSSQIEEWEEETDKLLVQLPIVGNMIRKVWYDTVQKRVRCRVVDPGKFIVNNRAKILNDVPRCTEEIQLYPVEIEERKMAGMYRDVVLDEPETKDPSAPHEFIEQHRRMDLDDDGYPEPYIVTVHVKTEQVVRIIADFEVDDVSFEMETQTQELPGLIPDLETGELVPGMSLQEVEVATGIETIRRGSYFVSYQFLPAMDGSFHGTGLGLLLGDISESINSIINMLMDAGHMASLGGGFIGSDLRLKGGAQRFKPGEWRSVGASGSDISRSIVPITYPQPDATLFQMLGMLIEAGREIASVKDVMTGDSGQKQMTATTTIALIEQGMMVFTAAYKRIFRSMRQEFKLIARINAETVSAEEYNAFHDEQQGPQQGQPMPPQQGQPMPPQPGQQMPQQMGHNGGPPLDPAKDYSSADMDIEPVADPQSVTKMQQSAKAQLIMQLAEQGLVDRGAAAARIIEASDIGDVEELAPKPDPMQEQMAQINIQLEQAKADAATAQAEAAKIKALAESRSAQDHSVEFTQMQFDAQIASDKLAQDAALAREKMALERQQALMANQLALTLKRMELSAPQRTQ